MTRFPKLRTLIKSKLPATFNDTENETSRILERILENENISRELITRTDRLEQRIEMLCTQISELSNCLAVVENIGIRNSEALNQFHDIFAEIQLSKDSYSRLQSELEKRNYIEDNRSEKILRSINELKQVVSRTDLNSIVSCKSDKDYDKCIVPLNKYFNNRGMAMSMHLTSVAEKPDPIVYETADIIRTSTLSLIADEIHNKKLDGAVAELGVAEGKFARVINALFPEKTLHLFDTFEGFPKVDADDDRKRNYSNIKPEWYAGIDMTALMTGMRYPNKCVIHKGYFPDTAQGLEESFCFVNIDCDLYKPILAGLEYFYPRMVKGGYIFIHDYRSRYYTGVRPALAEFAEKNNVSYCVLPDNTGTAIIIK